MTNSVLNGDRTAELWAAIKTLLAGKVDLSALDSYPTIDAMAMAISTALSDYAKDSDVRKDIAEALVNYMTASEINEAIAEAVKDFGTFKIEVVDRLPEVGEKNVFYFVPSDNQSEKDIYIEYVWVNGRYERIGSTSANLSQYWSKEELKIMTAEELEEILQ